MANVEAAREREKRELAERRLESTGKVLQSIHRMQSDLIGFARRAAHVMHEAGVGADLVAEIMDFFEAAEIDWDPEEERNE